RRVAPGGCRAGCDARIRARRRDRRDDRVGRDRDRGEGRVMTVDTVGGEVVELLQQLIRNACVNDGTPESGGEDRSADVLEQYLEGSGLDLQRYEPIAGRASLVGRLEGTDPTAPSLLLMGHTDVVPVTAENWRHDPFGAEVVEGEIWGRGAVDMLNLTASMAVAAR